MIKYNQYKPPMQTYITFVPTTDGRLLYHIGVYNI